MTLMHMLTQEGQQRNLSSYDALTSALLCLGCCRLSLFHKLRIRIELLIVRNAILLQGLG